MSNVLEVIDVLEILETQESLKTLGVSDRRDARDIMTMKVRARMREQEMCQTEMRFGTQMRDGKRK